MTARDVSFSDWRVQYSFPDPSLLLPTLLYGGGEGTGCSDRKMPAVAYGAMFLENEDLYAGIPLVGFIIILDPVNGISGQKNYHLQC